MSPHHNSDENNDVRDIGNLLIRDTFIISFALLNAYKKATCAKIKGMFITFLTFV